MVVGSVPHHRREGAGVTCEATLGPFDRPIKTLYGPSLEAVCVADGPHGEGHVWSAGEAARRKQGAVA